MTTELTKAAQQAPKIKELVEQLRNIANGVRICGVDDRRFVAGRLDEIADALTQRPAAQTEREAFEAEMRCEETWGHRSLRKHVDGRYQNWVVDALWTAWQARASLPAPQQATPEPVGEVVAYKVNWPGVDSVGMRRFYGADEWEACRATIEFLGGVAIPLTAATPAPEPKAEPVRIDLDAATAAGEHAALGHLSRLVDEAADMLSQLRAMTDDMHKQWCNGGAPERGEFPLLDRVDDWLAARSTAQAEPVRVPEGWRMDREGDDAIVVQHQAVGLARATNPATSMHGLILFMLCDDILQNRRSLTAAQAKGGA